MRSIVGCIVTLVVVTSVFIATIVTGVLWLLVIIGLSLPVGIYFGYQYMKHRSEFYEKLDIALEEKVIVEIKETILEEADENAVVYDDTTTISDDTTKA